MIAIKQDAEFMTNLLPANPVSAGNRFVAFKDANSCPALLSLSQNNKLDLIIEQDGVPTLNDFGKIAGLNGAVQAFDAQQGPDLRLNIAIAMDAGNSQSEFCLVFGVDPGDLLGGDLSSNIIRGSSAFPVTHNIFMSDFTRTVASKAFPLVFLAFEPADRITKEEQLGLVDVSSVNGVPVLTLNTEWKLATNPQRIVAVAFGTCRVGQGAFVLYESTTGVKLQFKTFYGRDFTVEPVCPTGAKCLASFVNPNTGYSVLLVGGDVITQFTSQQYVSPTATGTTIATGDKSLGLKGIHVSLAGDNITIWYTTIRNSAHYYSAQVGSMNDGKLVPLLPDGQGGRMSGLLAAMPSKSSAPDILLNMILSVDQAGNLTLMQQASDTRIWESRPFYIASRASNMEISGYTVRIQAVSDDSSERQDIASCQLRVASSGYVRAIVNGKATTLNRDGDWYQADTKGVLNIIFESMDITTATVHVVGFRSQPGSLERPVDASILDPTHKVTEKLSTITNGNDLLNAKTQSGETLVQPGTISQADADKAVAGMVILLNQLQGKMEHRSEVAKAGIITESFWGDIVDDVWDAFHYVVGKAEDSLGWVIDEAVDAFTLTVSFAEQVYVFVIQSVETIMKGISWILAKIGIGIKKLIDFAGFVFNWSDILQTSDSISLYLNAGLDYGEEKIASLDIDATAWVEELRATIKTLQRPQNLPMDTKTVDNMASQDVGPGVKHGVAFNWSGYQITHGGFSSSTVTRPDEESEDQLISDIWNDLVREYEVISGLISKLSNDIFGLFDSGKFDSDMIYEKITDDFIDAALSTIENVVDAIVKAVLLVVKSFRDFGNATIECPVFSALWDFITGGTRSFTIFNCFALILAIPCTALYKVVTGTAPPDLKGRLTKETFAQYVNGEYIGDPNLRTDIEMFASAGIVAVEFITTELLMITFVTDYVTGHMDAQPIGKTPVTMLQIPKSLKDIDKTMVLDVIGLIFDLPSADNPDDGLQGLRWFFWILDFIGVFTNVAGTIVESYTHIPKKKFAAGWQALSATAGFIIILPVHSIEYTSGRYYQSFPEYLRRSTGDFLKVGGATSFFVSVMIKDQRPLLAALARVVMYSCKVSRYVLKAVDFCLNYKNPKPPKPWH